MSEATVRSQANPEFTISEDKDSSMNLFLQPRVTASGISRRGSRKFRRRKIQLLKQSFLLKLRRQRSWRT